MADQADGASAGDSPDEASLRKDYFDRLYRRSSDGDPWEFRSSRYEAEKYATTLAHLTRPRYPCALEVGCSIGVFTRTLADRVGRLWAIDLSEAALTQAKIHCVGKPHVQFALLDLLEATPRGPFDLIILAEVGYYWTKKDFTRIYHNLLAEMTPDGQILLVHWRAPVPDYPQSGDELHLHSEAMAAEVGLIRKTQQINPRYRLDLWEKQA